MNKSALLLTAPLVLACGLCASQAHAQCPTTPAPMTMPGAPPAMMTAPVVDARHALPLFPALTRKDGFFLEHTGVDDLGLEPRITFYWLNNPLGSCQPVSDRVVFVASAVLSVTKWVAFGAAMPFLIYQQNSGLDLSKSAIGDLRLMAKLSLAEAYKGPFPKVAVSLAVSFPVRDDTADSRFGAGQASFYPRLIVDWVTIRKRLKLVGNIGGVIAGTGSSCDQLIQGMMKNCTDPDILQKAYTGLGNHFTYGVGAIGILSEDAGIILTTELVGAYNTADTYTVPMSMDPNNKNVVTTSDSSSPLFWDIGLYRSKANKWTFGVMYGHGITAGSPGHMVMAHLGYAWEYKEPDKDKVPKLAVDVTVNLPPGLTAKTTDVTNAPPKPAGAAPAGAAPAGAPPAGGATPPPGSAAPPPGGAQPPAGTTAKKPEATPPEAQKPVTIDVEVPKDWWPKEKDKDKK